MKFNKWIFQQLLLFTWKPQTFKSCLAFATYNLYVLSFCDLGPQGYFVEVICASVKELVFLFSLLCSLCAETGREERERCGEKMLRYWQLWAKCEKEKEVAQMGRKFRVEKQKKRKKTAWSVLSEWVFLSPDFYMLWKSNWSIFPVWTQSGCPPFGAFNLISSWMRSYPK